MVERKLRVWRVLNVSLDSILSPFIEPKESGLNVGECDRILSTRHFCVEGFDPINQNF